MHRRHAACGSASAGTNASQRSLRNARRRSYDGWLRVGGLQACAVQAHSQDQRVGDKGQDQVSKYGPGWLGVRLTVKLCEQNNAGRLSELWTIKQAPSLF